MALAVAALLALGLALVPAVVTDSFTLQVLLLAIMFGALGACWNLVGGFLGGSPSAMPCSWAWAAIPPCCCCIT